MAGSSDKLRVKAMNSRRDVLIGIAASGALAAQEHQHAGEPTGKNIAYVATVFKEADLETVAALCETILPKTKTAGARDTGCHLIVDEVLSTRKAQQAIWRKGLVEVNGMAKKAHGKTYAELTAEQQAMVMTTLSEQSKFFQVVKDATIDAYYSTKEGLMSELGWNANTFLSEFKGCTHPEHQK